MPTNVYSVAAQRIWEKANNPAVPASQRKELIKEGNKQAVNDVFGVGHKVDIKGNPIEMGVGSPQNQTRQSVDSFRKYHAGESDFDDNLKRLETQLAECEKRRDRDE